MTAIYDTALVDAVEEAVEAGGLDVETSLRWDYSGRAMYGRACLALVGSLDDLVRFVVALTRLVGETVDYGGTYGSHVNELELLLDDVQGDVRQDQLGRDAVFYWPNVRRAT